MPYKNRKKEYAKRKQERALEKLSQYEEFEATIAPKLRALLADGNVKTEDILEFGKKLAAARTVTIATMEMDSSKALAAAKDVMDRTMGKAVERSETTHKFEKMSEEELDAVLLTKLAESDMLLEEGEGKPNGKNKKASPTTQEH